MVRRHPPAAGGAARAACKARAAQPLQTQHRLAPVLQLQFHVAKLCPHPPARIPEAAPAPDLSDSPLKMAQQLQRPFGSSTLGRHACPHARPVCMRVRAAGRQQQEGAQQQAQQQRAQQRSGAHLGRRALLQAAPLLLGASAAGPSLAAIAQAPAGFKLLVDKLDGYSFAYPELWTPVTSSGNDVFLRNPFNVEENLFVDISSPSSSRYGSVEDLGSPQQAAQALLDQYLNKEFMSTRIGIRREGEILRADKRVAEDGRTYYDLAIRMTSYASRNPYTATQVEVMKQYSMEWDRVLCTTLGVANSRLYELRLQSPNTGFDERAAPVVAAVQQSFRVREVEA